MRRSAYLIVILLITSLFPLMEVKTSGAEDKSTTFVGKVIGIRAKLWLDVESQTDKAIMNFRIGRKTVYVPHRYPNPGETVKVEFQTQRGVPVAFTVTIVEGPKEGSKEGPKEKSKDAKEGTK